ncbi:hypothetical protein DPMN_185724 [Dreissena polymorpha]|uniref:Uncharacterized protein n=1 Tax=Dreissena polymorpha TaxID=45954 RepID=A0A9D4DMT3_DREPO|nr:hypothetical protein DPMN_185724 [Dreissena polymorpha]
MFHQDWAINVTSRVLSSKAAPPPGGHIFQQTETTFKLSLAIIKTNVQTKFHEDWTINVTPRVLISKTALPLGVHVFLLIQTIFKLNPSIQETVLTKFNEDWTKNVTSRAENCPPSDDHVFSPIWTIFELVRDINQTNVLTKFHDVWAKIVTSRVFTENTAPPPCRHVFQWTEIIFELNQHIIKTNILTNMTKFHEDRTINVASSVFTRQMLTTGARRTKGDHSTSP